MLDKSQIEILKAHIALNVRNVGQSIEFYQKMFGIEPVKVRTGYAKFDVQIPPLNLSLNEIPTTAGIGSLSHLGIQVANSDDVTRMKNRWSTAGLETRDEIGTDCCYALQDKAWTADPDGNQWEVFTVIEDNLETSSPCCGTGQVDDLASVSDLTVGEV